MNFILKLYQECCWFHCDIGTKKKTRQACVYLGQTLQIKIYVSAFGARTQEKDNIQIPPYWIRQC